MPLRASILVTLLFVCGHASAAGAGLRKIVAARTRPGVWIAYETKGDRTKSIRFVDGHYEAKLERPSTRLTITKIFDSKGRPSFQQRSMTFDGLRRSIARGTRFFRRQVGDDDFTVDEFSTDGGPGRIFLRLNWGYHRLGGDASPAAQYHVVLTPVADGYAVTTNDEAFELSKLFGDRRIPLAERPPVQVSRKLLRALPIGTRDEVEAWLAAHGALAP